MSGFRGFWMGTVVGKITTLAVLVALLASPVSAWAQDADPFTRTGFTSAKFGTEISWTRDWSADREQSRIEQKRDLVALASRTADAAVLIELQSQRSFRTADALLTTAMERYTNLDGYEQVADDLDSYPPSLQFEFGDGDNRFSGHIQAQVIAGAMMAVVVLALPGELDAAMELVNAEIQVNGVPLLDALPVCGQETESSTTATATATESASSGDSKTSGLGGSSDTSNDGSSGSKTGNSKTGGGKASSADCVEVVIPTPSSGGEPTPEPTPTATTSSGRGGGLTKTSYSPPTFPGVSLQYDSRTWEVTEQVAGADNPNGRDQLILSHTELPAVLYVEAYAGHNGRAAACIDLALGEAGISPGTDEPLVDENGELIQGSERGRVWGAYAYELEINGNTVNAGGYVECRSLPGAAGVLVITLIVRIEAFDDAYAALQPILRSIVFG